MPSRLSVYFPAGRLLMPANPFGKDIANLQLFRSLALYGGFEQYDVLSVRPPPQEVLTHDLVGDAPSPTRFTAGTLLDQGLPAASGALLRGAPDLFELSWMRRQRVGDRAYSLMGVIHTLAPPAIRQMILNCLNGPTHPWDAVICTSPSVRDVTEQLFARQGAWLAERTGGRPPPTPMLPVVPLGVDGGHFAALADRPEARRTLRERLGLAEDDVLVLWVGRLSFFEKAFPQPMFRAVQQAAGQTGARVTFALAGWFPGEHDRALYEQSARIDAPDVDVRFLDGNDRALLSDLWAAADIFLSLVDNIQETFGITPVEAMAAGLPVVVSDWDGYRFTVRDGVEGFLIPTLGGPANGRGETILRRHTAELESYQTFVGTIAQHTAVHVGRCAEALARLIRDPDLRRRMGAAGRERVRTTFDWPVVVQAIKDLADELAAIRAASPDPAVGQPRNPARGDPFADFAGFATTASSVDLQVSAAPGVTVEDLRRAGEVQLNRYFAAWRATDEECLRAFELIAAGAAGTVREVLLAFPVERRRAVDLSIVWMAKLGLLEWGP